MSSKFVLLVTSFLFFSFLKGEESKETTVVQWALNNLPQTGILKEQPKGYVYLKVDKRYINQLFPLLKETNYSKPPFFRRPDAPGAHISVFYRDERDQTGEITEIGKKYSFTPTGLAYVPPRSKKYIILEVDAPELEKLRKKYGLSPLLKDHKFHITIAKKNGN